MSQMGFFDADKRLSMLSAKGDPLVDISSLVPWETFRDDIEAVVLTADAKEFGLPPARNSSGSSAEDCREPSGIRILHCDRSGGSTTTAFPTDRYC